MAPPRAVRASFVCLSLNLTLCSLFNGRYFSAPPPAALPPAPLGPPAPRAPSGAPGARTGGSAEEAAGFVVPSSERGCSDEQRKFAIRGLVASLQELTWSPCVSAWEQHLIATVPPQSWQAAPLSASPGTKLHRLHVRPGEEEGGGGEGDAKGQGGEGGGSAGREAAASGGAGVGREAREGREGREGRERRGGMSAGVASGRQGGVVDVCGVLSFSPLPPVASATPAPSTNAAAAGAGDASHRNVQQQEKQTGKGAGGGAAGKRGAGEKGKGGGRARGGGMQQQQQEQEQEQEYALLLHTAYRHVDDGRLQEALSAFNQAVLHHSPLLNLNHHVRVCKAGSSRFSATTSIRYYIKSWRACRSTGRVTSETSQKPYMHHTTHARKQLEGVQEYGESAEGPSSLNPPAFLCRPFPSIHHHTCNRAAREKGPRFPHPQPPPPCSYPSPLHPYACKRAAGGSAGVRGERPNAPPPSSPLAFLPRPSPPCIMHANEQLETVREYEESALVGRATVHFLAGNLQQALADLSQVAPPCVSFELRRLKAEGSVATARFPESTDAWQRRAVVLLKLGRLEEAKDYRAAVADLSPLQDTPMATVDVLRTLGWASAALGAFKAATAMYGRAAGSGTFSKSLHGWASAALGAFKAATEVYGRAVRLFPQEGALWREKGCSHKELGEVRLARECLETAVAVERGEEEQGEELGGGGAGPGVPGEGRCRGEDLENYHKLALLHMHTGKPRQALEVAREGLQLFPQSTNLHYLAASAHHALANFSAAARHYSTVLALGGRSQEENAQLNHNLAFYQEAWMRKEPPQLLPPSVVRYTTEKQLQEQQQQRQQQQRKEEKRQQEVELSEEALALVEKADELGPRAMYHVGGFLHDPRKLRMAGLAALDVMQRASSAWQAMLKEEEEEEQEQSERHGSSGSGRSSRSQGEQNEQETRKWARRGVLESTQKQETRKWARRGGWRDMLEAIVQWRQIADPIDSVTWIKDNKESYGSHVAATPIVDGQMDNYKYFQFHDRAFALIKDRLLTTQSATAASGSPSVPLSASALKKVRKASGLRELHAAVGRDFYVQLPCHSRAHPGKDIGGIQLALVHVPPGFVFAIRIGLSPQRWKDFYSELDAAWQALGTAVVEARRAQAAGGGAGTRSDSHKTHKTHKTHLSHLPHMSHMSHMSHVPLVQRQKVQRAILDLAFYWYHLSPLSRGSAMVGWVSVLGLCMAAGLHTTALVPQGMQ
ncbi:unnamed protein product, partial [Closterium sp. NIES-65]